jgi:PAS domain S-box-containing protein
LREENYETLYKYLYENNRDAVVYFNGATIIDANQAALDLFEVSKDEFIGKEIFEFSVNREKTLERIQQRAHGISSFYTSEIKTPNGVKNIEVSSNPVNIGEITSYGLIRDVTAKLRLEHRYREIFESSADLIFVTNEQAVVFINPRGLAYLGLSNEDEIIGKSTVDFIHPDYIDLATQYSALRRAGGNPPSQYRSKMVRKDGKALDVEFNASFIDWDGVPSSLTIVRDITWQVQAEKELRDNEERLTGFIQSATDGISILTSDMRYLMVNDTELKYTGRKREDYIGRHILDVFPELKDSERYKGYLNVLKTGEPIEYRRALVLPERNLILDFSAFKAGDVLGIMAKDVTAQVDYQRRLEALHSHAQQISTFESRDEIAKGTMDIIFDLLGFRIGSFGFVQDEKLIFTELREESRVNVINLDSKGITVRAVLNGETQLVNDTRLDSNYLPGRVGLDVDSLSELDVPIKIDDHVVALINLEDDNINAFNEEDKNLVETLGAYVASSIARIDYEQRLTALHEFALTINQYDSLESIAKETLRIVDDVFDIPYSTFGVLQNDSIWFPYVNKIILPEGHYLPMSGKGVTVKAIKTGTTQVVDDVNLNSEYVPIEYLSSVTGKKIELISAIIVPVFEHDQAVGAIDILFSHPFNFTPDSIRLIELMGEHVSARLTSLRFESERIRAEQAEEMQRIKTRFVSTATHELRTPLTSVKGYLELARSEQDIEKIQSYLEVASRNAERLDALTRDLLDQQRIEEGRLEISKEPVNLNELVTYVLEEVTALIGKKNQHITSHLPETDLIIKGDEMRLGQVLVNLIDNASNYSPKNSDVKLVVEEQDDNVLVSLIDEGIGLSEEDIGKMFTPFPDIDRPVVSEQSVGLGLSICKGFIDLHGGKIWAESEGRGKGSTFRFTLPK